MPRKPRQKRQRPRSAHPDALRRIDELTELARTPKEILRALEEELPFEHVPSLRTIQRVAAGHAIADKSETWLTSPLGSDDDELVLPVLAEVITRTEGRRQRLSKAEAERIAQLRRAAPDMSPWRAYFLARLYLRAGSDAGLRQHLDAVVGFATWRDGESLARYVHAGAEGWVPGPKKFPQDVEAGIALMVSQDTLTHTGLTAQELAARMNARSTSVDSEGGHSDG